MAQNTVELAAEIEGIVFDIRKMMERVEGTLGGEIPERFHDALRGAGMKEAEAGGYSETLSSWKRSTGEDLEGAVKNLTSALHVVVAASHRAPRGRGNALELRSF